MADKEGNIIAKDYGIGIKPPAQTFHVKGMGHAEWGMKTRLSQIFAADGRTIMLARCVPAFRPTAARPLPCAARLIPLF